MEGNNRRGHKRGPLELVFDEVSAEDGDDTSFTSSEVVKIIRDARDGGDSEQQ